MAKQSLYLLTISGTTVPVFLWAAPENGDLNAQKNGEHKMLYQEKSYEFPS